MYTLRAELKAEKYKNDLIEKMQIMQDLLNIQDKYVYSNLKEFDIRYLEEIQHKYRLMAKQLLAKS